MDKQNLYPIDRFPPTNCLAAAIRRLPHPDADVRPQEVDIDAGPIFGRYRVTFVVRENSEHSPPSWFWGVESSERIAAGQGGSKELNDPGNDGSGI